VKLVASVLLSLSPYLSVTLSSLSSAHSPTPAIACDTKRPTVFRNTDTVSSDSKHASHHLPQTETSFVNSHLQLSRTSRRPACPAINSSHRAPSQETANLKMRSSTYLTTIVAFILALLASAHAQSSSSSPSSYSYTTTMTITLIQANATSYVHYTSSIPSAGTVMTGATATGASGGSGYSSPVLSATPSICTNCMGSGAGTCHSNLVAVGLAGVAALFWSTL
jgi:hypothetical protein